MIKKKKKKLEDMVFLMWERWEKVGKWIWCGIDVFKEINLGEVTTTDRDRLKENVNTNANLAFGFLWHILNIFPRNWSLLIC